ncbi:MAG: hypothetical protein FP826_09300 [Sphingomonadales bacterium]|nr:hypothetical protein [Sphingomonadales bacterium]MBU3991565.1 hypothetical protein [Alphaproteobacteria bacterium]
MGRKITSGMIQRGGFPQSGFNLHNQAVLRANYQGPRSVGFTVEFLGEQGRIRLDEALQQGVVVIRESSIEAVQTTTDEVKQKMRTYLDGHFTGSAMHGNNHRRVSNAAVQSVYFNDIADKGQFTALIYSKFGIGKGDTFVDYLLLHMRGGTVVPKSGDWLRIANPDAAGGQAGPGTNPQTGYYPISNSDIFFAKSKDGQKLYQLRRFRGSKKTVLLATLLKSLKIAPSLQGLEAILASRGAVFERNFDAIFSRKKAEGRFV